MAEQFIVKHYLTNGEQVSSVHIIRVFGTVEGGGTDDIAGSYEDAYDIADQVRREWPMDNGKLAKINYLP